MASYNLKVFDYGEFVQYRIYERPIIIKEDDETQIELNQTVKDSDSTVNTVKDSEHKIKDKEHSESVSINRTIQTIYKYAQANSWEWFVTLTFKRDMDFSVYDYDAVVKRTTKWLRNLRRSNPDIKYLFVPEQHKDGAYHFHGLLANCDNLRFEDSGKVAVGAKAYSRSSVNSDYPTIYNLDNWRYGFSTATKVLHTQKVSSYICKYITKDMCQHIGKRRRFYPSNNLSLPMESEHLFTQDDLMEFKESICDRIDYQKSQTIEEAHQMITYITVQK